MREFFVPFLLLVASHVLIIGIAIQMYECPAKLGKGLACYPLIRA